MQSPAMQIAPMLTPFFRRFHELKQRLQMIVKPTTPTLWSRLASASCVSAIALFTFTTARAQPREGEATKPAIPESKPAAVGEKPKAAPREGDGARTTEREGEKPRRKMRAWDGEQPKDGPRDGDRPKAGARDGEGAKAGPRDGDKPRSAPREGEPRKREGDKPEAR